MDSIEPVWLFGAIALACGVCLGMLINRLMNPSAGDIDQLKADLERERTEMERYKASVNSHFNKTSDLVKELTQDYVKVYQHLAEGAQTLSDSPEFSQVLEQPRGRVLISMQDESPAAADADTAEPASESGDPVDSGDAVATDASEQAKPENAVAADSADANVAADAEAAATPTEADAADDNRPQAAATDAGNETLAEETDGTAASNVDAAEPTKDGPAKDYAESEEKSRAEETGESAAVATDETASESSKKV